VSVAAEAVALRPGLALPDWSVVTDPEARRALAAAKRIAGRAERWSGLSAAEDALRRAVLRGFAAAGRFPEAAALAESTGLTAAEVAAGLDSLRRRDLLVLGDGAVVAAYPFTAGPTPHRARVAGAPAPLGALCAIDALGVGAMLGRDAVVESVCAETGDPVRVATRDAGRALASVAPEGAVVWSGLRYAGGCAATSGCAVKLFFASDAALARWRARTGPAEPGFRLTVEAALQVGRALFGPMLA
jgi:hypothetical protein